MTQTIYEISIDEDGNEKNETFKVLSDLGITPSQAIEMFFAHVRLTRSIPFSLAIENKPNSETIKVIEEANHGENIVVCKDTDDLFHKLNI